MCVILMLKKSQRIDFEKLKNAVLNNPDGFGIVGTHDGKMEIFRDVRVKGNDPDFVMERLEEWNGMDRRFLHVRKNTVGLTSLENCHPFEAYKSKSGKSNHVVFMHNGTFYDYRPPVGQQDKSDSAYFTETFLSPLLNAYRGPNGYADTEDLMLQKIIDKFFGSSRGVLISNRFEPMFLGKFEVIKDPEYGDFLASNDDYFKAAMTSRMHESQRSYSSNWPPHKASTETNGAPFRPFDPDPPKTSSLPAIVTPNVIAMPLPGATKDVTPLKEIKLSATFAKLTPEDIKNVYVGSDSLSDEDIDNFAYIGISEWTTFCTSEPVNAAKLIDFMTERFQMLLHAYETVADKHQAATKLIAKLKNETAGLEAEVYEMTKYATADH